MRRRKGTMPNENNISLTLCTDCANAYSHRCTWISRGEPRADWTATPHTINEWTTRGTTKIPKPKQSFQVEQCPDYVPDAGPVPFGLPGDLCRRENVYLVGLDDLIMASK